MNSGFSGAQTRVYFVFIVWGLCETLSPTAPPARDNTQSLVREQRLANTRVAATGKYVESG